MQKSSNSPKKRQVNSQRKGKDFQRRVAQDLRAIYDPPDWWDRYHDCFAEVTKNGKTQIKQQTKKLSVVLKGSVVRQGRQAEGAVEPDIVVTHDSCPIWNEAQDGRPGYYNPLGKLQQAETDIIQCNSVLWPVSVCHLMRRQSIEVCMRIETWYRLLQVPYTKKWFCLDTPIIIDYGDYLAVLEAYKDKKDGKPI